MSTPFHQRLYLRIWLAVVAAVVVLAVVAGWLANVDAERDRSTRFGREIVVRNAAGDIIGQAPARPTRAPGQGPEFQVPMRDGTTLFVQLPRPVRPSGAFVAGVVRLPFSFAWMLALLALAVAVGTYPFVRRLTKRLEAVQTGVERWGQGDLATRLAEDGQDEVAFLAKRFNHSAEQIQTLLVSQSALLASQKSLLANASHELRSPLARIRMGLELDQAGATTPAQQKSLKAEINRNIDELDQLIEEILLASRLDAKEADLGTVESLDLMGLAAEECARVGAELDAKAASSQELVVKGVAKLLRRALRNLLENAARYGAGEITVSLRTMQSDALITVCDRGPGVPAAYQLRIFEPFFRLPGASEQSGGVGLGLALVKSIAARHGGSVSCENRPQGGACFAIRLPLQPVTNLHAD
jgi:two-component system, OmpR family, sensor kinase